MLVIRLQRRGKKNQPFFWIVVAEKTAPIRGKFIERLGFLNPLKKQKEINKERVKYWLSKGVKPSDSVYNLILDEKIIEGEKRKIKITKKKKKEEKKPEEKPESKEIKEGAPEEKKGESKETKKEEKIEKKEEKPSSTSKKEDKKENKKEK